MLRSSSIHSRLPIAAGTVTFNFRQSLAVVNPPVTVKMSLTPESSSLRFVRGYLLRAPFQWWVFYQTPMMMVKMTRRRRRYRPVVWIPLLIAHQRVLQSQYASTFTRGQYSLAEGEEELEVSLALISSLTCRGSCFIGSGGEGRLSRPEGQRGAVQYRAWHHRVSGLFVSQRTAKDYWLRRMIPVQNLQSLRSVVCMRVWSFDVLVGAALN